jgi:hypothetical protein
MGAGATNDITFRYTNNAIADFRGYFTPGQMANYSSPVVFNASSRRSVTVKVADTIELYVDVMNQDGTNTYSIQNVKFQKGTSGKTTLTLKTPSGQYNFSVNYDGSTITVS